MRSWLKRVQLTEGARWRAGESQLAEQRRAIRSGREGQLEQRLSRLERQLERVKTILETLTARERILNLVEEGQWRHARAELDARASDPSLVRLREALAPPRVMDGGPASGRPLGATAQWLKANRAAFRGQWVALHEGELLDSGPSRKALHEKLKARGALDGALFVRIED